MSRQKLEGVKGYLEILGDGIVLSRKDELLDSEISSGLTYIGYNQIFKIDFETAGKFTNGFIHFILKDQLNVNVFEETYQKGQIFLFDFFQNDKMIEIKKNIAKKIEEGVEKISLLNEDKTRKMISLLSEIKELHVKGVLTKKQYEDQKKILLKKI